MLSGLVVKLYEDPSCDQNYHSDWGKIELAVTGLNRSLSNYYARIRS